ncbi:MAG: site-specific DNA-methyltransferase [Aigarchaeota archaeon]|nr:site-specific DNA-methyltransferase [Aigarchaeota archaeon]MDW8092616.1 DNA methyltransferase [Nitrososphaerota archaeon]
MSEQSSQKVEERYDLWRLVTFLPNKEVPVHRWFYYKEGFSRELVWNLLTEFGIEGGVVLDPFVGSGTTTLTCMERGIESIGIDTSPLAVLVSYAKTRVYDPVRLETYFESLIRRSPIKVSEEGLRPITMRVFKKPTLLEILAMREHVSEIPEFDYRSFFTLALMRAAMRCSYVYKDGSSIRIVKRHVPPFRPTFRRVVREMVSDVKSIKLLSGPATIIKGDARSMERIEGQTIDAIITSPPYLNKIEYTRVYEVEEDLFLHDTKRESMRSYIGTVPKSLKSLPLDVDGLPDSAIAYLSDMEEVLREMYRVLVSEGTAAIVVAGAVYNQIVVETDVLIAEIAQRIGFEVKKILAVNRRAVTSSRVKKIGEARESIVYLMKP